jgi:hypothetical protein
MTTQKEQDIERGLGSGTRFDALLLWCGNINGGVDEDPEWRDWTHRETTPDQMRIEDVLATLDVTGATLLHIGIGNSRLAQRFCRSAQFIDGITLQASELRHGVDLGIENYNALIANKYDPDLDSRFHRVYDFIIDNNPSTFCCCRRHLATMLANYTALLKPGGVILTDTVGLGWTSSPNDSRWGLNQGEWYQLGRIFQLVGERYTDTVIGLRKPLTATRL